MSEEKRYTVLVADDCEHARTLVELALEAEPLDLIVCEDGTQAVEACKQQLPDLAIIDVQMPGLNGLQVCEWLKSTAEENFIPVMLLTSQSEISDRVSGLDGGADEYVIKPFALPELSARTRALLRVKELTDSLREARGKLQEKEKQLVAMQVAGAAAHELGQPLTALLLNCELLEKLDAQSAQYRETLRAIQKHCQTMSKILAQLNRLADYETKEYLGDVEIVDLYNERPNKT